VPSLVQPRLDQPTEWAVLRGSRLAIDINHGQRGAAGHGGRLLICDTDALATSIWHERYLGTRSPDVEALAAGRTYALYVLTADDIPFVQDGTRDGEHLRGWMTDRFRQALAQRTEPWIEVRGDRAQRLAVATARIDQVLHATIAHPARLAQG
jgi:HTH-type transcriptional repressor of NAD biosynthesis genes